MVLLVICGSHVVVNAPSTSLWSESGVHACHRVTRHNYSQQCACGDSDQCGGGYSSHPGLRRGPGVGSVRSGSSGWSPARGRLPSGLFDNFNVIIALSQNLNYFKTSLISA